MLLSLPHTAQAAVAFDAVGPSSAGAGGLGPTSPVTWSHTTSGNNRLLVVGVALGITGGGAAAPTVSVSYAGVSMAKFGRLHTISGEDDSDTQGFVEIYYLVAPAKGTNTVSVSISNVTNVEIETGSVSFTGVDQRHPIEHSNSGIGVSGAPSISVTSAVGNMVVDILGSGTTITASGGSQNNRWLKNVDLQSSAGNGAQSTRSGLAIPVPLSYTTDNDAWGLIALDIHSAPTLSKPPNNLGLVGYWSFNEGTGTIATDFSGNGNTGTVSGASWTSGKRGRALQFDGSDHVRIDGVADNVATGAATIAFWFRPASTFSSAASTDEVPFTISDAASNNDLRFRLDETDGTLDFENGTGGQDILESTQTSWSGGTWYHIVGTISAAGTAKKLYVNATLSNENNPGGRGGTAATEARIGSIEVFDLFYNGTIDDVRVYNRELGSTEVAKLYQAAR